MPKFLCQHLFTLKLQKIANFFAKAGNSCSGNKKHEGSPLGICLNCGVVRCNGQDNQCCFQHFYGTKHTIVYKIRQKSIYCFACSQNIGDQLKLQNQSSKRQKVQEIYQRIIEQSEKLGQRCQIQLEKKQVKVKKVIKIQEKQKTYKKVQQTTHKQYQNNEKHESKQSIKLQVFGLKNLGNTCFFNSTLQCLYACQELHRYYSNLQINSDRQFGKTGQITLLFKKYLNSKEKHITPKGLMSWASKMKPVYKHMDQQDAQELLALLLNGLIDGQFFWREQKPKPTCKITPTQQIFGFYLAGRLQCLSCQKVSWSLDFSLQIPVQLSKSSAKAITLPQGQISLDQINEEGLCFPPQKMTETFLDTFFAPQMLGKQNYFVCQKCEAEKAWRKFYLKDPPLVLTISLKRFNNNLSKNNAAIKVPYRLELEGHCINKGPLTYELFALSEHSGSARGGHYIAYSRRGSEWFYFSDSNVKGMSWERVRSSQPYILFYKRIE